MLAGGIANGSILPPMGSQSIVPPRRDTDGYERRQLGPQEDAPALGINNHSNETDAVAANREDSIPAVDEGETLPTTDAMKTPTRLDEGFRENLTGLLVLVLAAEGNLAAGRARNPPLHLRVTGGITGRIGRTTVSRGN